ncbi:Metallo-dependent phosphatase [Daedaleopsis nitida]|nr:Metallo-dependent phosphatase [Daedaleopsis nitida]
MARLIWLLVVFWYELGTFYRHTSSCPWPDEPLRNSAVSNALPTHVLVVADPQILDRSSYPDRPPWLVRLSQFIVDLNLRKSWRAAMRRRPDAVVFLGDMMDNGRLEMSDQEYEAYVRRFKSIFPASSGLPVYYLPGNHDIGLGAASPKYQFSDHAVERYTSHFGVLNQRIAIANHTVWLIDAPGLVDEDRERTIAQMSYAQWADAAPDRTIAFVQRFSQRADPEYSAEGERPILFSHVPLFRPERTSCGTLRERGTIRQGSGLGYQNLLPAQASQFLLANIRPAIIFSGDDHDYCEYVHSLPTDARQPSMVAPEITVKSFSMAMGIRRPGYQLLSLVPPTPNQADPTFSHRPCLLPDQLGIYLSVYIPFFCLTLLALLVSNVRRVVSKRAQAANRSDEFFPLGERSGDEIDFDLPPPSAWRSKGFPRHGWSWSFTVSVGGYRRRVTLSKSALFDFLITFFWRGDTQEDDRYRRLGIMRGFAINLRDAAWAPLGLFVLIAWWVW